MGYDAYDFSTTDLVHIQVASRLTHLMLQELQKINLDDAPPSLRMTAMEHARPFKNPFSTSYAASQVTSPLHRKTTGERSNMTRVTLWLERRILSN